MWPYHPPSDAFIAVFALLGLVNLIFTFIFVRMILKSCYQSPTKSIAASSSSSSSSSTQLWRSLTGCPPRCFKRCAPTVSMAGLLDSIKRTLIVCGFLCAWMAMGSQLVGLDSARACYWMMKLMGGSYVIGKLLMYLFLLIRGRTVRGPMASTKRSWLEVALFHATVVIVPLFVIVVFVLVGGNRLWSKQHQDDNDVSLWYVENNMGEAIELGSFDEVQCVVMAPYGLPIVLVVLDLILSIGYIVLFAATLLELVNTQPGAIATISSSPTLLTPRASCSRSSGDSAHTLPILSKNSDFYMKIYRKHLWMTVVTVISSICSMLFLSLSERFPTFHRVVSLYGVFDLLANVCTLMYLTQGKQTTTSKTQTVLDIALNAMELQVSAPSPSPLPSPFQLSAKRASRASFVSPPSPSRRLVPTMVVGASSASVPSTPHHFRRSSLLPTNIALTRDPSPSPSASPTRSLPNWPRHLHEPSASPSLTRTPRQYQSHTHQRGSPKVVVIKPKRFPHTPHVSTSPFPPSPYHGLAIEAALPSWTLAERLRNSDVPNVYPTVLPTSNTATKPTFNVVTEPIDSLPFFPKETFVDILYDEAKRSSDSGSTSSAASLHPTPERLSL